MSNTLRKFRVYAHRRMRDVFAVDIDAGTEDEAEQIAASISEEKWECVCMDDEGGLEIFEAEELLL